MYHLMGHLTIRNSKQGEGAANQKELDASSKSLPTGRLG